MINNPGLRPFAVKAVINRIVDPDAGSPLPGVKEVRADDALRLYISLAIFEHPACCVSAE